MLVLSRKIQEQILIPDLNIRIIVLSVGTNRVQIGNEAPKGIQITRPNAGARSSGLCERSVQDLNCSEISVVSKF